MSTEKSQASTVGSQSFVGVATAAAKVAVTSAILANKKHQRQSKLSHVDDSDSSEKKLVVINEEEAVVQFDRESSSRTIPMDVGGRSRSPSPTRTGYESDLTTESNEMRKEEHRFTPPAAIKKTTSTSPAAFGISSSNVISNLGDVDHQRKVSSPEATGVAGIEFYLPQLNTKDNSVNLVIDSSIDDPTALRHILRPWQAEFLESQGIVTASQFLKAKKRKDLSKAMKRWRRRNHMKRFDGEARKVALHIWARTCKNVITSVKTQLAQGKTAIEKPQILKRSVSITSLATAATASVSASSSSYGFDSPQRTAAVEAC